MGENPTRVLRVHRREDGTPRSVELAVKGVGEFSLIIRDKKPYIVREVYYHPDVHLSKEERRFMYARAGAILRPKKKKAAKGAS